MFPEEGAKAPRILLGQMAEKPRGQGFLPFVLASKTSTQMIAELGQDAAR